MAEGSTNTPAKQSKVPLVIAFVVGAVLAAIICVLIPKGQDAGGSSSSVAAGATQQANGTVTSTSGEAKFDNDNIDYAKTFPSWNKDSKSLAKIIEFVKNTTDESSPDYVEPADRIATFDMDGTVLCEKAPRYVDYCLTWHRVLDDPTYNATDEEKEAMLKTRDKANTDGGKADVTPSKDDLVASAFAGMTQDEFRSYTLDFANSTNAVGFEGMTYAQSFYKPMIEIIDYLRANDFDVWVVSACEREVTRAMVSLIGIPTDHVIATDVALTSTKLGDQVPDEYNMELGEQVLLSTPLNEIECGKTGKPLAIAREIGKRPILSFGNSDGDYAMLNYAQSNPDHKGMGVLVLCDDTAREYGDMERAEKQTKEAEAGGWTIFHMSDEDWATIYGENVKKTQLPGPAQTQEDEQEELKQAA